MGLADIPHVLLLVGGAGLVALELLVLPGTIWIGLAGALAILLGLIWSFTGSRLGFEYGLDRTILVEESFRGQGIATSLLERAAAWLEEHGAPRVMLWTAEKNPTAQRLFEHAGFRRTMVEMTRERRS